MREGKYSAGRLLGEIIKLEPIQFLGVCKILNIEAVEKINEEERIKDFSEMWSELCDKIEGLNRVRRRNLGSLIYAATKKEKEKK